MSDRTIRMLFICTGNSARSQMAEGLARALGDGRVESYSAGTDPKPVHPLAIRAMAEIGVDISQQASKGLAQLGGKVVTLRCFGEGRAGGMPGAALRVIQQLSAGA